MKKIFFKISKKFAIREIRKIPYEKPFFSRQAIPTTFLLYPLITLVILNAEFGLIWTTPWPVEKEFFLKLPKIRNSRKSQNSVRKPNFFPRPALQIFLFYTLITLVIINTEFGLIWKTPWPDEKDLFLKFLLREIQKVLYENPTFFLGKLNQCFLLYTIITLVILNTEFGLIWTVPWPDEKKNF